MKLVRYTSGTLRVFSITSPVPIPSPIIHVLSQIVIRSVKFHDRITNSLCQAFLRPVDANCIVVRSKFDAVFSDSSVYGQMLVLKRWLGVDEGVLRIGKILNPGFFEFVVVPTDIPVFTIVMVRCLSAGIRFWSRCCVNRAMSLFQLVNSPIVKKQNEPTPPHVLIDMIQLPEPTSCSFQYRY